MVELLEAVALTQPLPLHTRRWDRCSLLLTSASAMHYICDVMFSGGLFMSG
jgi:hypothetical protein